MFKDNCNYSEHVCAKLIKVSKCLILLRSLWKVSVKAKLTAHLALSFYQNFTYGLSVYGAIDSDLMVIQNFLDRCLKKKYISKRMDVQDL